MKLTANNYEVLIRKEGFPLYLIVCEKDARYSLVFEVYKTQSFNEGNEPYLDDCSMFFRGNIKSDGEAYINFGDSDGYINFGDYGEIQDMKDALGLVYLKASATIKHFDK